MRVALTVITHPNQSIWQNGIGQNVFFLAMLLRQLPFVREVLLVDVGDGQQMPPEMDLVSLDLKLVKEHDAIVHDMVDVLIEVAGAVKAEWLTLMRARGRKTVMFHCGNPYTALAEPAVFGRDTTALYPERCDEVWYPYQYRDFASFLRLIHRCEAFEMPYLWHPRFVDIRIAQLRLHGKEFGYQPRVKTRKKASANQPGWRAAIFEPNVSVNKSLSIPMLICDQAYRADDRSVAHMHVLNSVRMKDHLTLLHLANSLNLVREHKATFHGRVDVVGFMTELADLVVSHQWKNEQNYVYLDALYGDYPLVHNSPWIKDVGYYYPDFDIQEGASQLLQAIQEHDGNLKHYRSQAHDLFEKVSPFNQMHQEAFAHRLLKLCPQENFA